MFYILDDLGFIEEVSTHYIERENKTCTEYKGTIPTGYETLDDWVLNANIRAYKIVDGNLTYDANRAAELEAEWNVEEVPEMESGSNENGSWIKYRDGTMIITQSYETTVSKSTWGTWGSGYGVALNTPPNFPIPFVGKDPVVTQTLETTNGNGMLVTRTENDSYSTLTRAGAVQVFRPAAGLNATYRVNIIAIGKWK